MNRKFNAKQIKTIELLSLGDRTQVQISEELGVLQTTISKWKRDPAFMQAVVDRSRVHLKASIPDVYKALADKSKEGKDRHIKIFLDHLEKLEGIKASQASITFTWLPPTNTKDTEE